MDAEGETLSFVVLVGITVGHWSKRQSRHMFTIPIFTQVTSRTREPRPLSIPTFKIDFRVSLEWHQCLHGDAGLYFRKKFYLNNSR